MAPAEIQFVANYLTQFLLTPEQQSVVCPAFIDKLNARFFPHHWYPLEPERGSGYRAVSFDPARQDGYLDPVLSMLAHLLGTSNRELRRNILKNFGVAQASGWTLWTDPGCVSLRVQASGGELQELWGNLPAHLSHPRVGNYSSSPNAAAASRPSPGHSSPSPSKSRAIPILAPAAATRLAVTPPTPNDSSNPRVGSDRFDQDDECRQEMLADALQVQYKMFDSSAEDPYFRPSSRTSSASSSSEGSDQSGFSSSSSSTATSIAPLGFHVRKKLSINQLRQPSSLAHQLPSGYIRHHSTNSVPYVSMSNALLPASLTPMTAVQPQQLRRAASPAYSGQRRRHVASASVSSVSGGRGLLVLKEGPGTVTEHSGGKVGVMGGGVLLGLPKDKDSGAVVNNNNNVGNRRAGARRTRTTGSSTHA